MKLNKLFLVSMILLAIITIGAVSASDELAVSDEGDVVEAPLEDVDVSSDGADDVLSGDVDVIVDCPKTAVYGDYANANISVALPDEDLSDVYYSVLSLDKKDEEGNYYEIDSGSLWSNVSDISFKVPKMGLNNLRFIVTFSDNTYPQVTFDKKVQVSDYLIGCSGEDEYRYGDSYGVSFSLPNGLSKDIDVYLNGVKYDKLNYDDEMGGYICDYVTVNFNDLKYGKNTIAVTYPGDKTFAKKTFKYDFDVYSEIKVNDVIYGYGGNVTLKLPSDASGKLIVSVDGVNQTPVDIKEGNAVFFLSDKLELGLHGIGAWYVGDDKYPVEDYDDTHVFSVLPYLKIPKYGGVDGCVVTISMPEKYNGIAYAYYYDDNDDFALKNISNAKITKGKGTLPLKFDYNSEYSNRIFTVKIVCGDYECEFDGNIEIISSDSNWDMKATGNNVLKVEDEEIISINNDEEIENYFELTVDGKKTPFEVKYGGIHIDTSNLTSGEHTFKLNYLGNGYFKPVSKSGSFNVDDIIVKVDGDYFDMDYGTLEVTLPKYQSGKLTVKLDGKVFETYDIEREDYDHYQNVYFDDLKYGIHNLEFIFKSNKGTLTKKMQVNASYLLDIYDKVVVYGGGSVYISLPNDAKSKLTVFLDGVEQKLNNYKGMYLESKYFNTTENLAAGNHTVTIKYAGDSRYPACEVTKTLKVVPVFKFDEILHKGEGITVIMPEDAKGNFVLSIKKYNGDDEYKPYKTIKAAGKIFVTFDDLDYGGYKVIVKYTGDDYDVECDDGDDEYYNYIAIAPDLTYSEKVMLGDSLDVSVNVPGMEGNIFFETDKAGARISVPLVDGKATISIPSKYLQNEYNAVSIEFNPYYNEECDYTEYNDTVTQEIFVTVVNPIVANDIAVVYANTAKYSVKINDIDGKPVKSGKVTFSILDGKKQITKKTANIKNGVATLSFKITQGVKTYSIKTVYKKASVVKKVTVKHLITFKPVTVKKSAKKLVLTATLGKVDKKYLSKKAVTFKFNGKTYKAKTNKKGVAKVTVPKSVLKKLKVGKKVTYQATYLKDTFKLTAVVKK